MQDTSSLTPGMHVLIRAFDDVPKHAFVIQTIEDGFVTGIALTGPLSGEYGEPDIELATGELRSLRAQQTSAAQACAALNHFRHQASITSKSAGGQTFT